MLLYLCYKNNVGESVSSESLLPCVKFADKHFIFWRNIRMRFELQRADFWKRISALLFDMIALGVVMVIAAIAMSWVLRFDDCDTYVTDEELEKIDREIATDIMYVAHKM